MSILYFSAIILIEMFIKRALLSHDVWFYQLSSRFQKIVLPYENFSHKIMLLDPLSIVRLSHSSKLNVNFPKKLLIPYCIWSHGSFRLYTFINKWINFLRQYFHLCINWNNSTLITVYKAFLLIKTIISLVLRSCFVSCV